MKYIRTKEHIYKRLFVDRAIVNECGYGSCDKELNPIGETIVKEADTIEELIQIGDIVFYWQQSDDKEHCVLMVYDSDIHTMQYNAITKLLIPVEEDYKCVAKGYPSFNLIMNRRYLVNKGVLELL